MPPPPIRIEKVTLDWNSVTPSVTRYTWVLVSGKNPLKPE